MIWRTHNTPKLMIPASAIFVRLLIWTFHSIKVGKVAKRISVTIFKAKAGISQLMAFASNCCDEQYSQLFV